MALTVSEQGSPSHLGNRKLSVFSIEFDNSYVTGGEPFDPLTLGFESVELVVVGSAGGYVLEYDYAASTIIAWEGDNNNANDAPGVEAGSTDDLSAVTTRAMVLGT